MSSRSAEIETLQILGSGGFYPAHGRQTMSFLTVRSDGRVLLLDAGTGLARLASPAVAQAARRADRLDIVLTHYHLDHVVGLAYLSGVWDRPVRLFAPTRPLVDTTPEEALGRLVAPPLFPATLEQFPHPVELISYDAGFELDGLAIEVRRQNHPGGSVGLRLGSRLAYVTDTSCDPQTQEIARAVDLLLHEVWCTTQEATIDPALVNGHSATDEVLELARLSRVGRLLPVHHHPKRTPSELTSMLEQLRERGAEVGVYVVEALDEGTVRLVA